MNEIAPERTCLLPEGRPDWERVSLDVRCSRCDYNLYLLEQPRCPECGLEFEWATVFDTAAWTSDFLFEHHWRKRPVRSYLRTFAAGL